MDKKKKKRIFPILPLLLAAAIVCAGIYFYPLWRAAKVLEKHMDLAHFTYELDVELDREALGSEQVRLVETLAGLTGVRAEALYHFRIQGSVWEEKVYALLYPEGAAEPFVELYLGENVDVINEAMLYNVIRNNLLGQNALLSLLVPAQEGSVYMTLEQVERMFGVDLGGIRSFSMPSADGEITAVRCFIALAVMSREQQEDGERFTLEKERIQAGLELSDAEKDVPVTMRFLIREPAEALEENAAFLSKLGIKLPDEQLRMFKSVALRAVPGAGSEIVMPTEYVSQDIIDLIARIRELFTASGESL